MSSLKRTQYTPCFSAIMAAIGPKLPITVLLPQWEEVHYKHRRSCLRGRGGTCPPCRKETTVLQEKNCKIISRQISELFYTIMSTSIIDIQVLLYTGSLPICFVITSSSLCTFLLLFLGKHFFRGCLF